MSITATSCLFLLGNYGVAGNFDNDADEWFFIMCTIAGFFSLIIIAVWQAIVIYREIKRDQEQAGVPSCEGESDTTIVTGLSSWWIILGVVATTTHVILSFATVLSENNAYEAAMYAILPTVITLFILSLFAQPRRCSRKDIVLQYIHFGWFNWVSSSILAIRASTFVSGTQIAFTILGISVVLTGLFFCALKIRAAIGRLPDEDLSDFLTEILFKGGFKMLCSVLFVLFRCLKCEIEFGVGQEGRTHCMNNSYSALFVSIYLVLFWLLRIVQGSIKKEWRKDLSLSTKKIAKMQMSVRRAAEGAMLIVMIGCGAFLFALINAKEPDKGVISLVGLIGGLAGGACVISEIITVTMEQKKRSTVSHTESSIQRHLSPEAPIDRCSWCFVTASFFITISYTALQFTFVITQEDWTWKTGDMILPLVGNFLFLGSVLRPKDQGAGLKVLHIQIFTYVFLGISLASVGHFKKGRTSNGWSALIGMPFWYISYSQFLKLRKKVSYSH